MRSLVLRRASMRALLGLCGVVALAAITLAMSCLNRVRVTIDDDASRLTLLAR